MKKVVIICVLGIGFVGGNVMLFEVEVNLVYGEIYYKFLKLGEIYFDVKGNIIKLNLLVDWEIFRIVINYSFGRWVYYSDIIWMRKIGYFNYYSCVYNCYGVKVKVGNFI